MIQTCTSVSLLREIRQHPSMITRLRISFNSKLRSIFLDPFRIQNFLLNIKYKSQISLTIFSRNAIVNQLKYRIIKLRKNNSSFLFEVNFQVFLNPGRIDNLPDKSSSSMSHLFHYFFWQLLHMVRVYSCPQSVQRPDYSWVSL